MDKMQKSSKKASPREGGVFLEQQSSSTEERSSKSDTEGGNEEEGGRGVGSRGGSCITQRTNEKRGKEVRALDASKREDVVAFSRRDRNAPELAVAE